MLNPEGRELFPPKPDSGEYIEETRVLALFLTNCWPAFPIPWRFPVASIPVVETSKKIVQELKSTGSDIFKRVGGS